MEKLNLEQFKLASEVITLADNVLITIKDIHTAMISFEDKNGKEYMAIRFTFDAEEYDDIIKYFFRNDRFFLVQNDAGCVLSVALYNPKK